MFSDRPNPILPLSLLIFDHPIWLLALSVSILPLSTSLLLQPSELFDFSMRLLLHGTSILKVSNLRLKSSESLWEHPVLLRGGAVPLFPIAPK